MAAHRHDWHGVGGCEENPGVWSIQYSGPRGRGNGQGIEYYQECDCGASRHSMSWQGMDGVWHRGRWMVTDPGAREGADE